MATTWGFYADAGLTVPLVGGATIIDGDGYTDRLIYFGSPAAGKKLEAASAPGTDAIAVGPDYNGSFTVGEADISHIKLALSAVGLDSATAGAPIVVGTTLYSGSGGAVPIYVRSSELTLGPSVSDGLELRTNGLAESAV